MNTGEDVGIPGSKDEYKHPNSPQMRDFAQGDAPNRGITRWQIDHLISSKVQPGGCQMIFTHAPLVNLEPHRLEHAKLIFEQAHFESVPAPNLRTAWLGFIMDKVSRSPHGDEPYKDPDAARKLVEGGSGYIVVQGYEHINWSDPGEVDHPFWSPPLDLVAEKLRRLGFPQTGTRYFKEGHLMPGLAHGVAANYALSEAALRLMADSVQRGRGKTALALSGHTHVAHEFRIEPLTKEVWGIPTGYSWEKNGTMHVIYHGHDHHVHELGFNYRSGWYHNDLTERTDAPTVWGNLSGFTWKGNQTMHVVFVGEDEHVHELGFGHRSAWYHSDLTAIANGPAAFVGPCGFAWEADKSIHVVYKDKESHVHELCYQSGSKWRDTDLSRQVANPEIDFPLARGLPSGFAWEGNNTTQVICRSLAGHLFEFGYGRQSGWRFTNLTQGIGAPLAIGERVSGLAWEGNKSRRVFYRGADGHVHELIFDRSRDWYHNDLTQKTSAPSTADDPFGFVWEGNQSIHVVYRSDDGHIHELRYERSGWQHQEPYSDHWRSARL